MKWKNGAGDIGLTDRGGTAFAGGSATLGHNPQVIPIPTEQFSKMTIRSGESPDTGALAFLIRAHDYRPLPRLWSSATVEW